MLFGRYFIVNFLVKILNELY
jgi:hypothetical protein